VIPIIILEGPDGAGKSHLAKRLSLHFDMPIAPKSMDGEVKPLVDMKSWIETCISKKFQSVIYDRFALISGPLYAPILKDQYQLNAYQDIPWMFKQHWQFYTQVRPIIVYCLPPLQVVKDNLKKDDSNQVIEQYIEQIYVAYVNRAALDSGYSTSFLFNYTAKPSEFDFEKLINFIADTLRIKGLR